MILLGDIQSWVVREGALPGATQHTITHARMHPHAPGKAGLITYFFRDFPFPRIHTGLLLDKIK